MIWRLVSPVEAGGRGYDLETVKKMTFQQAWLFLRSEEDVIRNGRNTVNSFSEAKALHRARKRET